ncbi:glycine zipper 2TM domain-containing protein [Crenobacter cavernae]|uniref:Glycine zipper 2TM domain-containing protein n=1 Tax=Crenobacter cavernae TaxID=2290923 RepID=A0A345Y882_9NEIS|nr:glycine zipper 2TM domain-containing protein [Crenobacter cavernae]AXK40134.1 glycine zipper 2TM domain-containing protein [Crenobacter cavernae]RXZ42035.1 glycine zipper 2TM domain-containing protein [Crenobacter cavernae]
MQAAKTITVAILMAGVMAGCSNMTDRQRNTAIGAAGGAVLGSVLTGGDAVGTVGGAAVGGVIGNQIRK